MRSVVAAAPDLGQAAGVSLQQNTDALSRLVASAYGSAHADRFTPLWQRHLGDLVAYAKAVAAKDSSARKTARAALLADADAYGSWLAGASKGQVQASDAAAGVQIHVEELMDQADAFAARDYAQAYRIEREAYEHMFTARAALAKAGVTPEVAVGLETPVGCQKSGCHAAQSYSWISPPRTSRRRSWPRFGALLASPRSDGSGVAKAKLRCGRCRL